MTTKEQLIEAIKGKAIAGTISCGASFAIAGDLSVDPLEVGHALDDMDVEIIKCQMGLFGYKPEKKVVKPAESVSEEMKKEIAAHLKEGKLTCADAWAIAKKLKVSKMDVSAACETMGIKITSCQLGAFDNKQKV